MSPEEWGVRSSEKIRNVEIPFPDGSRVKFKVQSSKFKVEGSNLIASASVIKDAGDDPDVTNGAEIVATVKVISQKLEVGSRQTINTLSPASYFSLPTSNLLIIKGGKGVGTVTKPGLPVSVEEAAINPVPKKMIREAVLEAISNFEFRISNLEITISVPNGEELAKKTLNSRLGIIGGISILGTTGIVRPVSSEAWTAAISSSMDVAKAMGHNEIILSAGRTSEKSHMKKFNFPEECYVMMGDYLEFSLLAAKKHGFKKIHLCAQWAKMLKIAMATPQTHVKHGAIDMKKTVAFLKNLGHGSQVTGKKFNTAREIFDYITASRITHHASLFRKVCNAAKKYAEGTTGGVTVTTHLVSYEGDIIASVH
ncbi:MAG: cobalt-precorrin-5B (C(1))-methyltransferase [Nitrospirae bacterium]|nr:cobalt-precorrin-5B (C(1))-methyltransferase [Nitrospirota bacterium]